MIKDNYKEVYTSPITEALEMRYEGVLCGSPDYGDPGAPGGSFGPGNEYNF